MRRRTNTQTQGRRTTAPRALQKLQGDGFFGLRDTHNQHPPRPHDIRNVHVSGNDGIIIHLPISTGSRTPSFSRPNSEAIQDRGCKW
jgi:hypothetical protein